MSRSAVRSGLLAALLIVVVTAQNALSASKAWVKMPEAGETEASVFAVVANGTMYDIYLTGVSSEAAATAELRQSVAGKMTVVKEVAVPAFGWIELASGGVHIQLQQLKSQLKTGDTIPLSLFFDNGATVNVEAVVK